MMACSSAHAGRNGQTVTIDYLLPDQGSELETNEAVVGRGNEVTFFCGALRIDLSDEPIRMRWLTYGTLGSTPFRGLQFHIDGSFGAFPASGGSAASTSGTLARDGSFDHRSLHLKWSGVRQGGIASFIGDRAFSSVPEPATTALFALGPAEPGAAACSLRT